MIDEKTINKIVSKLNKGTRIRVHRDYTSLVVDFINDDKTRLVIFKDWNKFKHRWDYHIERDTILGFQISLYKNMYKGWFGQGSIKNK